MVKALYCRFPGCGFKSGMFLGFVQISLSQYVPFETSDEAKEPKAACINVQIYLLDRWLLSSGQLGKNLR